MADENQIDAAGIDRRASLRPRLPLPNYCPNDQQGRQPDGSFIHSEAAETINPPPATRRRRLNPGDDPPSARRRRRLNRQDLDDRILTMERLLMINCREIITEVRALHLMLLHLQNDSLDWTNRELFRATTGGAIDLTAEIVIKTTMSQTIFQTLQDLQSVRNEN